MVHGNFVVNIIFMSVLLENSVDHSGESTFMYDNRMFGLTVLKLGKSPSLEESLEQVQEICLTGNVTQRHKTAAFEKKITRLPRL